MVGDLAAYFLILNIFSILGLLLAGDIESRVSPGLAVAVMSAVVGLAAGIRVSDSLKERQFHKAVLFLVILSGFVVLMNGLGSIST